MSLTKVTITGADDETDVGELIELSREFPFVEWGILVGSNTGEGCGCSRFPSVDWIAGLVNDVRAAGNHQLPVNLSLHVCGEFLRQLVRGYSSLDVLLGRYLYAFQRMQLNWHGERQFEDSDENILDAISRLVDNVPVTDPAWNPVVIFQLDGWNDELWRATARRFLCAGLFDRSHGAGILPAEWPAARLGLPCGWAGGLGPDNLELQLPLIASQATGDYWVDMETLVRSESRLDLEKVRDCLEIADEFRIQEARKT